MSIPDNLKDHILESIAEGVFTVDKDFKINFFNRAAESITGQKQEEVLGQYCKNVLKSKVCANDCPCPEIIESFTTVQSINEESIDYHLSLGVLWLYCDAKKSLHAFSMARELALNSNLTPEIEIVMKLIETHLKELKSLMR